MWDERNEDQLAKDINDHDQVIKRGYMSYLSENISIPLSSMIRPKHKKNLLNINHFALPYNISGTTEVVIMDKVFYKVRDHPIAKLIVSNILSNYAIFIVLTDLNDEWLFYWLTNDKHVMMSRAETSHDALAIIERALVLNTKATATVGTNFPIGTRCNYFRMSNFQHGEVFESETVLDSFLNRPKVQFEFEDEIANMKDMFDDMTEKEISDWKVK
ncbi:12571_t:CDS:2 [Gigaspora margarita]|uniref:12571_t:CDS:1 n=1 Tax=Gigaspora margarita TaxID=4874 RepID=A0ABN7VP66_GIGMA|nr:12571_t:CDS:2 [Gigaspora margarita]